MKTIIPRILCASALLFSSALFAHTDWVGFKGDNQRNGRVAQNFAQDLTLVWQHKLPTTVTASPIVSEDRLIVAGLDGVLYAFDINTQTIIWTLPTGASIRATATADANHGYVLSEDGNFYAFELATGRVTWQFKTLGQQRFSAYGYLNIQEDTPIVDPWDYLSSSAVISNDLVIFGSSGHHVYALERATGKRVWSYKTGGAVHSSPALWGDVVIVGSWDGRIYALDAASGKLRWQFATESEQEFSVWLGVQASPTVVDDQIYIGGRDGYLYRLDAATGEIEWRYDMARSWVLTTVAVSEQLVFVGSSDTGLVIAIERDTGNELWRYTTQSWNYSSPLLFNDAVLFSSMLGKIVALNFSGELIWEQRLGAYHTDTYRILDENGRLADLAQNGSRHDSLYGLMSRVLASGGFMATPAWANEQLILISNAGDIYIWQAN
ncbi:MAG: PQQ-binding-like beta-propeller repeat protein [Aliidiomarina sp.]|uniref:outer membrane protein assembly factor BamB family protein n=1 Tax=Aliidiomarina sp. TaxID=1872439 RepID=UPI0025B8DA31|nr:PQQ-binding-like beta-propeller repeat protein [Aliidiomarina sp.]MCH8500732.1 PQQ-binding-like beta-propeller repeat protein [Aliidiomarina sp.]